MPLSTEDYVQAYRAYLAGTYGLKGAALAAAAAAGSKYHSSWNRTPMKRVGNGAQPSSKRSRGIQYGPFLPGRDRVSGYYGRYNAVAGEKKFFDGTITKNSIAQTGAMEDSLVEIAQGTTEKTRIGRLVRVHSLHVRGQFELDSTATSGNASDRVRILFYVDKQCNGAAAAVTDILEAATIDHFRNLANSRRFYILLDKTINLNQTGAAYTGAAVTTLQLEKGFKYDKVFKKPLAIEYDSTAGAITEIRSNNIGCLLLTSNGLADFTCNYRVRFTD